LDFIACGGLLRWIPETAPALNRASPLEDDGRLIVGPSFSISRGLASERRETSGKLVRSMPRCRLDFVAFGGLLCWIPETAPALNRASPLENDGREGNVGQASAVARSLPRWLQIRVAGYASLTRPTRAVPINPRASALP